MSVPALIDIPEQSIMARINRMSITHNDKVSITLFLDENSYDNNSKSRSYQGLCTMFDIEVKNNKLLIGNRVVAEIIKATAIHGWSRSLKWEHDEHVEVCPCCNKPT